MSKKRNYLFISLLSVLLFTACGGKAKDAMYETALRDAEAGNTASRELNQWERVAGYDAEAQYRYEGRRADTKQEENLPRRLLLDMPDGQQVSYWLYPEEQMTEEQLLVLADLQFSMVPEEEYRPKDGQISFGEVADRTKELLSRYQITEADIDRIYPYYWSASGKGGVETPDFWLARVSCGGGYDYEVRFDASSGSLMDWYVRPEGWFDADANPLGFDSGQAGQYTKEQAEETAKAYLERIGLSETVTGYQADASVQKATPRDPERQSVWALTETGGYQVIVSLEDLSVCGFVNAEE